MVYLQYILFDWELFHYKVTKLIFMLWFLQLLQCLYGFLSYNQFFLMFFCVYCLPCVLMAMRNNMTFHHLFQKSVTIFQWIWVVLGFSNQYIEEMMDSELTETKRAPLSFEKNGYEKSLLLGLCKLRKEKQLCDACMVVGAHEYPVHRAVLASASPYFLQLFEKKEKESFVLKDVDDHHTFEYLLDYAYTGRYGKPSLITGNVFFLSLYM